MGVTAGGPAFKHKGKDHTPTAIVYFCPPDGDGSTFILNLGAKEEKEWKMYFTRATAFFVENILPRVARAQLRLEEVVPGSPSLFTLGSPPRNNNPPSVAPPPVDQTPGIKDGKKVRDSRKPGRIGIVRQVLDDENAIVDWHNEQKKRNSRYKIANLQVVPVLQETIKPIAANQRVQIIGGTRTELILRTATVIRFNAKNSFITLDNEDSGSTSQPIKIATEYLRIIEDDVKPVTVPAANHATKFSLENFARSALIFSKKRNIQLLGFTPETFVEEVKRKLLKKTTTEPKNNIQERSKRGKMK